jgi:hypothetical protein
MGLFSRGPKLLACVFCQDAVVKDDMYEHWGRHHLREVEADVGGRGFTFECPMCGPASKCWGVGEDDWTARMKAAFAVDGHLLERHGGVGSTFRV